MKRLAGGLVAGLVLFFGLPVAVLLAGGAGLAGNGGGCVTPTGNLDVAMTGLVVGTKLRASERVLLAAMEAGLVESGMRNLPHGHADSLGVLQQRPSQGWGTAEQIMDPAYAFEQFYKRAIPLDQAGWTGSAGSLAQAVQRSAFPLRYDERQADALALLAQLLPGLPADTCQPLDPDATASPVPAGYGTPGPCGLSPSTHYTRELIVKTFGIRNIGGCAPGSGHISGSYHYPDANDQAHALDVMVGADKALGDKVAGWAVANAKALNIVQVIWYGQLWQPGSGWAACRNPASSCAVNHNDHPHISVRRGT